MDDTTLTTLSEETANRIVEKTIEWARKNIDKLQPSLPWSEILFNSDVTFYTEKYTNGATIGLKFYLEDGRQFLIQQIFSSAELRQSHPYLLEDVIYNCLRAQMQKR